MTQTGQGRGVFSPLPSAPISLPKKNWPECVGREGAKHKIKKRRQTDVPTALKHSAPVKLFCQATAALRAGDKPTALKHLEELMGFIHTALFGKGLRTMVMAKCLGSSRSPKCQKVTQVSPLHLPAWPV